MSLEHHRTRHGDQGMDQGRGGVLRGDSGRVRLFWRLVSFMGIALVTMVLVGALLPRGILFSSVAMLFGGLVGGWALLMSDDREPGALGFYVSGAVPETTKGLGLGVGLGLLVVGTMALCGGLEWTAQGGTVGAWVAGGAGALAFLALPAAAEEAVLRGYPLQAFAEAWGPLWALGITSVAFGALHLANPGVTTLGLLNVAAAGLFLGVVYLKTASLWWATGAHLGWNWSHGYLADVPVSGLELLDAPFYEGASVGPDWLGGGPFGPEGSVVATVLVIGASIGCWRAKWLRPSSTALETRPLALAWVGGGGAKEGLGSDRSVES